MGAKIHRPNDADGGDQASNRRLSARLSPLAAETLSLIAMICDRFITNAFNLASEDHGFFRLGIIHRHGFSLSPSLYRHKSWPPARFTVAFAALLI